MIGGNSASLSFVTETISVPSPSFSRIGALYLSSPFSTVIVPLPYPISTPEALYAVREYLSSLTSFVIVRLIELDVDSPFVSLSRAVTTYATFAISRSYSSLFSISSSKEREIVASLITFVVLRTISTFVARFSVTVTVSEPLHV